MYVEAGRLHFHYNGFGDATTLQPIELSAGDHDAMLDYEALGRRAGRGRIVLDGVEAIGWTPLAPTLMFGVFEGLDVGIDRRGPVLWSLYERRGVVCLQRHDPRRRHRARRTRARCDGARHFEVRIGRSMSRDRHISV